MENGKFPYSANRLINFDVNLKFDLDVIVEKLYRWCKTVDLLTHALPLYVSFFNFACHLCGRIVAVTYDDILCLWFTFSFRLPRNALMLNAKYGYCTAIKYSCPM